MDYAELEVYEPYSAKLTLPDFINDAYADKQHFEIKAYADAENTKQLAIDGSAVISSTPGTKNVYLDVIVEDGYAVILENVVRIDESNNNETERVEFEFKVIDLAQTTEYPSVCDIVASYGETGGFGFSPGGNLDDIGYIDFVESPIQLQSKNFIILNIRFF